MENIITTTTTTTTPKGEPKSQAGVSECVLGGGCSTPRYILISPHLRCTVSTLEANHHTVYGKEVLYRAFLYKDITNPSSNIAYIERVTISYCS